MQCEKGKANVTNRNDEFQANDWSQNGDDKVFLEVFLSAQLRRL